MVKSRLVTPSDHTSDSSAKSIPLPNPASSDATEILGISHSGSDRSREAASQDIVPAPQPQVSSPQISFPDSNTPTSTPSKSSGNPVLQITYPLSENICFSSPSTARRFDSFKNRRFIVEKTVDFHELTSDDFGIKTILARNQLVKAVTTLPPFNPQVIWEFYAHLPAVKTEESSVMVYVRGRYYELSAARLNELFGLGTDDESLPADLPDLHEIASFLSAQSNGSFESLSPTMFSKIYSALYNLVCSNWMPTSNPCVLKPDRAKLLYVLGKGLRFNLGRIMFGQILSLGLKRDTKFLLIFPSVIYKLLDSQGFASVSEADVLIPPEVFCITKIKSEPIAKKKTVQQVRKTSRLSATTKGKGLVSETSQAKRRPSLRSSSRAKKSVKISQIEEISSDEESPSDDNTAEFEEFKIRIPKNSSVSSIKQAFRAGLQTFQAILDVAAKSKSSPHA